ncbi:MAG: hypothetical protein ABS81_05500 [Pseudonocardia sp. SCN 72-86]|nr:MAG: hypothetical protein ABS81_05500 [Pseudonocardia sp. SCN 72-86]
MRTWSHPAAGCDRLLWIDVSVGVAGDMLLAALLDLSFAAAPATATSTTVFDEVCAAIEAVVPAEVYLRRTEVTRAGLRACRIEVVSRLEDHPHRAWADIRELLDKTLDGPVLERTSAVFTQLARAEGRVHGIPVDDVHFHEVGAWDSIADIVGVSAALHALGVATIVASPVALGSGHVRTAHGRLPVPVPAVLELARGHDVTAGGDGELATPTGMAILAALAAGTGSLPAMRIDGIGIGAGTRDVPGHANVVRVVSGTRALAGPAPHHDHPHGERQEMSDEG